MDLIDLIPFRTEFNKACQGLTTNATHTSENPVFNELKSGVFVSEWNNSHRERSFRTVNNGKTYAVHRDTSFRNGNVTDFVRRVFKSEFPTAVIFCFGNKKSSLVLADQSE